MKTHQLIFIKDWPELQAIQNDWLATRKKIFWNLYRKNQTLEDKFQALFVLEVRRVIQRKIPIGRNPNDYRWKYHHSLEAISWGERDD